MKFIVAIVIVLAICATVQGVRRNGTRKVKAKRVKYPASKAKSGHTRIINGAPQKLGQTPFQAALRITDADGNGYFCGGSLIHPEWVLTAAHCVDVATSIEVRLGALFIDTGGQVFDSTEFHYHFQYNPETVANDIALIKLPSPAVVHPKDKNVKTIKLQPKSRACVKASTKLSASGWGLFKDNGDLSSILLNTNVYEIPNADCAEVYGYDNILATHLCTTGKDGESTCSGDSGGPLIIPGSSPVQVGVVSFGSAESCEMNYPAAFTRVSLYLDWLLGVTGINFE